MSYKNFLEDNVPNEIQGEVQGVLSEDYYKAIQDVLETVYDDFSLEISSETMDRAKMLTNNYAYDMVNVIEKENLEEYTKSKDNVSKLLGSIYSNVDLKEPKIEDELNDVIENVSLPKSKLKYNSLGIETPKYEEVKENIVIFSKACEKQGYDVKNKLKEINKSIYKDYIKEKEEGLSL